jgi:hypothetical protein
VDQLRILEGLICHKKKECGLYQQNYFIEKSSQTFADNLAAFGLAFILNGIADGRAQIRLEDAGIAFAIICEPALEKTWVDGCKFFAGAPFLITIDRRSQSKVIRGTSLSPEDLPESGDLVADYEVERKTNQEFFEWFRGLSSEEKRKTFLGEIRAPVTRHPDWELFRAVNPAALHSYNSLLAEWYQGREVFPQLLKVLLQMTANLPNDLEEAEKAWIEICQDHGWLKPKPATANQLLNPAQGKGTNYAKAKWRAPGNLTNLWLLEYLKVVGLRKGGFTRHIRGAKDRKTYALEPVRLNWGRHESIMHKFQRAMAGSASAIKLDIFACLHYTRSLLEHFEEARLEDLEAELFGRPATDLVSGMQMAYYKDMGNAIAIMNIASINLPSWVIPENPASLAQLHQALEELLIIARNLDESRGDQFGLLKAFRTFLSSNDLDPFFEFTNTYSGFIIHQYERGRFVRPLTTTTLEVIFMNSDDSKKTFSQIVQNEGFQNIAYAIRHSTVVPQGRKARGNRPAVDIRYGLGQQLTRKAAYPDEFLAGLADFVHLYNAENAQLREHGRTIFRKNLTTVDLDAITELTDQFGSKLICYMLVAYGYAREPYEGPSEEPSDLEEFEKEFSETEESV